MLAARHDDDDDVGAIFVPLALPSIFITEP